jgi:hypothetical protein
MLDAMRGPPRHPSLGLLCAGAVLSLAAGCRREAAPGGQAEPAAAARPPRAVELADASESFEALIRRAVAAAANGDEAALRRSLVTFEEYRDLLWPEFPVAKREGDRALPVHWRLLSSETSAAVRAMLADLGGRSWTVLEARYGETRPYGSYEALRQVVVRVADGDGNEHSLGGFGSIIRRSGRFKILNLKD